MQKPYLSSALRLLRIPAPLRHKGFPASLNRVNLGQDRTDPEFRFVVLCALNGREVVSQAPLSLAVAAMQREPGEQGESSPQVI